MAVRKKMIVATSSTALLVPLLFSQHDTVILSGNAFVQPLYPQAVGRRIVPVAPSSSLSSSSIVVRRSSWRTTTTTTTRTAATRSSSPLLALQAVPVGQEGDDGQEDLAKLPSLVVDTTDMETRWSTTSSSSTMDDNADNDHDEALADILRERTEHSFLDHHDDENQQQQRPRTSLRQAIDYLQSRPEMSLTRRHWQLLFDAIEYSTSSESEQMLALSNRHHVAQRMTFPTLSPARSDMTDLYRVLQTRGDLRVFGAAAQGRLPARTAKESRGGGDAATTATAVVSPQLWQQATGLPMSALTPSATGSNAVLLAGAVLAAGEAILSIVTGLPLNGLVFATVVAVLLDRFWWNGGILEALVQKIAPSTLSTIIRHEAGHFLVAYLLGCPVEGVVLSAFAALQDARFAKSTTAGTSFFDAELSRQLNTAAAASLSNSRNNNDKNNIKTITRSAIDRYSITVMAGIAAEAELYQQANGGAGDEQALIQFLSNLQGGPWTSSSSFAAIQNQARWGALQAVLLLRQYKASYDALVATLEAGQTSLADCIWAIEQAARRDDASVTTPVGYICRTSSSSSEAYEWKTVDQIKLEEEQKAKEEAAAMNLRKELVAVPTLSDDEMLRLLSEQRKQAERQLQEIEAVLRNADDGSKA